MYYWNLLLCALLYGGSLLAQAPTTPTDFNLTLVGHLPYTQELRDVWGYVDSTGIEYAIVGAQRGVSIVSLADPADPTEVLFVPGVTTTHRDLKTWGTHAYITAERGQGLMVVDLSPLPNGTPTYHLATPNIPLGGPNRVLVSAHNLFIDEVGYCYIAGSGHNNGGVVILDVHTDPDTPRYVGRTPSIYAHDAFARGDTLWTSDINDGHFSVYDVSDRSSPQLLATQLTPMRFTHNAWISDDGQTLLAADERPNAWIAAYDVSDLTDIKELDRYRTPTPRTIPHNTHTLNDYQVISYYTDGLIILDNSRPTNLVEVARYDTYPPLTPSGFKGAWGAYPYLPSGLILVSDINTGLHVLRPNYQRACWLEGMITDQRTGTPIFGARVELLNTATTEFSSIDGAYKTGMGIAGTYQVRVEKLNYLPQTVTVSLAHGVVTLQNIQLEPADPYTLRGQVVEENTTTGLADVQVWLRNDQYEYRTQTDSAGFFDLTIRQTDTLTLFLGQWGYHESKVLLPAMDSTAHANRIYPLTRGYKDDFMFDYNWMASGTAVLGVWERAIPIAVLPPSVSQPVRFDLPQDLGEACLLTGNRENGLLGTDDVDGGYTVITSPVMDLTTYRVPLLHFHAYFNRLGLAPGDDLLSAYLTNGSDTALVWSIDTADLAWNGPLTFRIPDYLAVTSTMRVYFEAVDGGLDNIVEGAIDGFLITDSVSIQVTPLPTTTAVLQAFPNPFTDELTLAYEWPHATPRPPLMVYNALGQHLETHALPANQGHITLRTDWLPGIYFLRLGQQTHTVVKRSR